MPAGTKTKLVRELYDDATPPKGAFQTHAGSDFFRPHAFSYKLRYDSASY